jgi:hypothetical protein
MTRRERMERRLEQRREWAVSAAKRSSAAFEKSTSLTAQIPFGQPVLVGHHSQRAHERAIEQSDSAMSRACNENNLAKEHERKAATLERRLDKIVFSDDSDAVEKIEARIARNEMQAAAMAAVNKVWKKTPGTPEERAAKLVADGVCSERIAKQAAQTMTQFAYLKAPLDTTNIRARIRTDRKRLDDIRTQQARAERAKLAGGVCIEGQEVVRITFAEKPEREIIEALRAAYFQWCGGAWCGMRSRIPVAVWAIYTKDQLEEGATP